MKRPLLFSIFLIVLIATALLTVGTTKQARSLLSGLLTTGQALSEPEDVASLESLTDPLTDTAMAPQILNFVDACYSAQGALTDAFGSVLLIPAVKGRDLPYVGIAHPTIIKPYLLHNEIVFTNQPLANYKLLTRSNNNPFPLPEEQTIIFRKMPGTEWEALISGWGNYYLGFGSGNIRAGNSESYLAAQAAPAYFELSFIHCKYEADGVTIWLNGNLLGKITTTNLNRRLGYGVGIETNSTDYNWRATMFIERGLTDSERDTYFKAIAEAYPIGSLPTYPYASNIEMIQSGEKLEASYQYNGKYKEDKSKVQYQWWHMADGLGSQIMISDAASIPYQADVKLCVKVYDEKGNSWMYVSGTYN